MTEPRYLLDANICIYLLEGASEPLRRRIEQCAEGEVVTSAVAFGEVMIGASRRKAIDEAERFFGAFEVLSFDAAAGRAYSSLPFKRGSFDRLIAAHAVALRLTLVTANESDFADIIGLRVENWTR